MKLFRLKVIPTIKLHSLISKGDRILLGLSGGPDSVCLFYLLKELKSYYRINFSALHVNYGIRKRAEGDEKYVKEICQKNNCGLYVYRVKEKKLNYYFKDKITPERLPLKTLRKKLKLKNFEEKAREIRYCLLDYLSSEKKFDKIAVGSQANDQAETVLFNFIRGGGLRGIGGMDYSRGRFIRPLLDVERKEIDECLTRNKIKYRLDESNYNLQYTRNKIRHKLIPTLKKDYNPQIVKTLVNNSRLYRAAFTYLTKNCREKIKKMSSKNSPIFTLPLQLIVGNPSVIQSLLIREIILKVTGSVKNLNYEQTIAIGNYLKNPEKKFNFRELPALTIEKNDDKVIFRKRKKSGN